jgi:putative lipoprotein (rSAM/lipoprotein system)
MPEFSSILKNMKIIRIKFLKSFSALITGLMAILGFAATCEPRVEYGTPSAEFVVNGKVTAAGTQVPIENIRVTMQGDTAFTDEQGNYQVSDKWGFPTDQAYDIRFRDIDNEANGEYQDLDTVAEFTDPEFTGGDGNWYEGETLLELNVKLTPKE